jgi:hypothetical protein
MSAPADTARSVERPTTSQSFPRGVTIRSEQEVRREQSIKRVSALGRQAGLPTGELEEISESLRNAYVVSDALKAWGLR